MKHALAIVILLILLFVINNILSYYLENNSTNNLSSAEVNKTMQKISIELVGEYDNIDLTPFAGYHFDMEKFVWCEKYVDLSSIQYEYNINNTFQNNNSNCDYIISIGNELKGIYIDTNKVIDDESEYKTKYYPIFSKAHIPFKMYIYKLDGRYNFIDLEYNTNLISEINENQNIPYNLDYYKIKGHTGDGDVYELK